MRREPMVDSKQLPGQAKGSAKDGLHRAQNLREIEAKSCLVINRIIYLLLLFCIFKPCVR
jgi:hypothetical protein